MNELIEAIASYINEYAEILTSQLRSNIKQKNKVASGRLYESIKFDIKTSETTVSLEILAEDYLKYVDEGRKAGGKQPPLESIIKWVGEKRMKKITKAKAKKLESTSTKQIAFVIAKSIKDKGIKPSKVLTSAIKSVNKSYKQELTKRVAAGLDVQISVLLKQALNAN